MTDDVDIKEAVRSRYAEHAGAGSSCCSAGGNSSCCGSGDAAYSLALGYDPSDLALIPEGSDLGLGCGNPLAILELREGETVLDLGSGGGIDCFIAGRHVGVTGRVIGVDMTPEMVLRARRNAQAIGAQNVEFRLGEIEHLPLADSSVDVVISNCVVNLVPDKAQVFREAFRVLRPGGRISVSDIVTTAEVPLAIRDSVDAYVACLSGAVLQDEYLSLMTRAGFSDIELTEERTFALGDVVADDLVAQFAEQSAATVEELEAAAACFRSIRVQAVRQEGV